MSILLKNLLSDPVYQSASLSEGIDMVTYEIIFEGNHINPTESYSITNSAKGYWTFVGDSGIKHFVRLIKAEQDKWKLKIGFFDGDQPIYDKPNLYFNNDIYRYDKKVLNTYIKALVEDIIPYFFDNIPNEKLYFPSIDKARYRLYKMMIERYLNKTGYEIVDDNEHSEFAIQKK